MDNRLILPPYSVCELTKNAIGKVCSMLKAKYNEEFVVTMIGDRINTGHIKFFVHPETDMRILFTAIIDRDGRLQDDYKIQLILHRIKTKIEEEIIAVGISGRANVSIPTPIYNEENRNYKLEDLVNAYNLETISISIIICGDANKRELYDVVAENRIRCNKAVCLYLLSNDSYDECCVLFDKYPYVSEAMITSFSPIAEAIIKVTSEGTPSISFDEFCSILEDS